MDEQTKKKISYALRGRKKSATHRKKIAEALKKLHKTPEHKRAIAEALRKYYTNNRLKQHGIL